MVVGMSPFSWPSRTPPAVFAERRARLQAELRTPALLVAGFSRARNFPHNSFPFRAESHFLYLVGQHLEGAALLLDAERAVLYAEPADPADTMWTGPAPTLERLATELELETRPISELEPVADVATLPPQDAETALWLGDLVDREILAGGGDELDAEDAALADAMIRLRLSHDAAAITQLREAAQVTARAHLAGMRATRPELREAAVRAAMELPITAAGMSCAYGSIVTVHGEVLHHVRHDQRIQNGDLLLADVGAETPEGWAGDVTRTWPVSGKFSASQRQIYEVVLAAQLAAIAEVRPGVRYLDVHRKAARVALAGLIDLGIFRGELEDLYARGAAGVFFPHGVGHLLGLDVHDMEDLGDRAGYAPGRSRNDAPSERFLRLDRDLAVGMAVTIEPGFYQIPELLTPQALGNLETALDRTVLGRFADVRGIRIEDDVLVTAAGSEVLSQTIPKQVDAIESWMRDN